MKIHALVATASVAAIGGCASASQPSAMTAIRLPSATAAASSFVNGGAAEIMLSQQFILHSKHVGTDFLIQISWPIPFRPDATAESVQLQFPERDASVVYVLDGGSAFGLYSSVNRETFVVGIAQFGQTLGDLYNARWRDFVHVQSKDAPVPPGGGNFADFIEQELKPFIEARLPVDPTKSTIAGYSLGGLFALHMLADRPDVFSN